MKEFDDSELDALEKQALVDEIRDLYRILVSPRDDQGNDLFSKQGKSEEKKLQR